MLPLRKGPERGRRWPSALILPALFFNATLAGCLAPPTSATTIGELATHAPRVAVEDAAGDARLLHGGMARAFAYQCRIAGGLAWGACATAAGLAPLGGVGGEPAPPGLDLLRGAFRETQDFLDLRIEVARLDEAFVRGASEPGAAGVAWSLCWTLDGVPECGYLASDPTTGIRAAYDRYTEDCNPFWWCSWRVEYALDYGEPGAITLRIPRALVGGGAARGYLSGPSLAATTEPPLRGIGPAGAVGWELHGGVQAVGKRDDTHDAYPADVAGPGTDVRLRLAASPLPPPGPFEFDDARDRPDRPDADILRVAIAETATHVTLGAQLGEVGPGPRDVGLGFGWGLPAGFVLEAFVRAEGGAWEGTARACTESGCGTRVPALLAVDEGSPGWVNLTFARADLGSPRAGDLTRVLYAWATVGEVRATREAGPQRAEVAHGGDLVEFAGVAPPHRFRTAGGERGE